MFGSAELSNWATSHTHTHTHTLKHYTKAYGGLQRASWLLLLNITFAISSE